MKKGPPTGNHTFDGLSYNSSPITQLATGVSFQTFDIPERMVQARSLIVNMTQVTLRLAISPELIERSFLGHSSTDGAPGELPPAHNSGLSLPVFLDKLCSSTAWPHLLAACNCLHTNFVRGNGFVFRQGRLICKPPGAVALDAPSYKPLNGSYTTLTLHPPPAAVIKIRLRNNRAVTEPAPWLAISGPQIVRNGRSIAAQTPLRLPDLGPTRGDEINFDPQEPAARACFTALGLTSQGYLLVLSTFAGLPSSVSSHQVQLFHPQPGMGLTLVELSDWLVHLGAQQAILGGGSGDTQQYIRGQETWVSLHREQPDRPQVSGEGALGAVRGLGAILLINS